MPGSFNYKIITTGYAVANVNGGTLTTGQTYQPNPFNGNYQFAINNGAHTLLAPGIDCALDVFYTNGPSAGAITILGFSVGSSTGDPYVTTPGYKFIYMIRRMNGSSTYSIKALQ